jgi:antitoxin component HigA of HigAB toxin-antitoxin module
MNVTITPIRTKKDYDKALTQIGKLLEAKKGTPEFLRSAQCAR